MKAVEFREIKSEIRLIGFDDGSFESESDDETCLVGVVSRGGQWIDGILVDEVEIDGMDSTSKIIKMVNESRHKEQLRIIMTSGITFAGFNVLDVSKVFRETGLPVIGISREQPDMHAVKRAIKNLPNWEERWEILTSAGDVVPVKTMDSDNGGSTVYIQMKGIRKGDAEEVVRMSSTRSSVPEPIRMAHIIATGISRGESVGRV